MDLKTQYQKLFKIYYYTQKRDKKKETSKKKRLYMTTQKYKGIPKIWVCKHNIMVVVRGYENFRY